MSYYSPIPNGIIQGKSFVYNSVVWVQNNDSANGSAKSRSERLTERIFEVEIGKLRLKLELKTFLSS
ncbi:hypothetical protein V6Z11_D09G273700 [Gossypium hirsutum]